VKAITLVLFSVLMLVVLLIAYSATHAGPDALVDGEAVITIDCYCGESESSTVMAYRAIQDRDMRAVLGLIDRQRIKALSPGDRAKVLLTSGKLARVRLLSGSQIGERCWIPASLLR
jgi:hypothetical protein